MRLVKIFIFVAVIAAASLVYFLSYPIDDIGYFPEDPLPDWELKLQSNTKVILIYTTLFSQHLWHGLEGPKLYTHLEKYNCLITYNKTRIKRADTVVFHGRDIETNRNWKYSAKKLYSVRQKAPKRQKWIFLSHENPQMDASMYVPYNGLFNWTATFSHKSDIPIPYGSYVELEKPVKITKNYAKEKTELIAWAVSHCNLMRQDYVKQLERFVSVTVYGKCRYHFKKHGDCVYHEPACVKKLSSYKFFLAFENDFCDDYVTEKYWQRIVQGAVPVVMGTTYDKRLVIPGSFVDASAFTSIKSLADYLNYLDSNDTAYNEYFKWKSTYKINPNEDLHIRICQALHSEKYTKKSQVVLSETFSYKTMCGPYQWKKEEFKKQIKEAKMVP